VRGDVDDEAVVVDSFDITFTQYFFLWGLVGLTDDELVAHHLKAAAKKKKADGVANLIYESEFTCWDFGINSVTCGIITPRTYRLRGDLVRIELPPAGSAAPKKQGAGNGHGY
jgi:hypothetical protein